MITPDRILVALSATILLAPMAALGWLGVRMFLGVRPGERTVARVSAAALAVSLLCALGVVAGMVVHGVDQVGVHLGDWFSVGVYGFRLTLLLDRLSMPFVLLTCVLVGVVGKFSESYMHRDPGYHRFYLLLLLFATAMLLLVMAGSIDLLFAGWELVGIASALLIAFFTRRKEPVTNGLRTFAIYRVCDVALLVAAVLIHHYAHSAEFEVAFDHGHWPGGLAHLEGSAALWVGLLLVFAAMGKSAQLPFSGWLPRAMEGPTPSSAIFYGGLSVHAGAYLLLRTSPVLDSSPIAAGVLVAVGSVTAIYATLVARVQSDAKNQLSYATIAQVGLILAEIGLGLRLFALVHIAGHATFRTLQFLRAPSILREYHDMSHAAGGQPPPTGLHYERLLPAGARRWLYSVALQRTTFDALLDRYAAGPLVAVARGLDRMERRFVALFDAAGPNASSTDPAPDPAIGAATEKGER